MSSQQGWQHLGKYELQERLGHGGMAEVWKAFDTELHRYVAIKVLHADLQADPQFITRFTREARAVAALHHPNIIQIYDFQTTHTPASNVPLAYMVMEYIEGQTLARYIGNTSRAGKFPPPPDIVHLFTSISKAIDYAHQQGMIHRDIKPANILLDQRHTDVNPMGEPVLTDFGIAKLLGATSGTRSGIWSGTPLYMSPEQVKGHSGNELCDIYSLGVILYEICAGVPPFWGEEMSPEAIMMQHMISMPTPPTRINPAISPALETVILRALAKDPIARFSSAAALTIAAAEALHVPIPADLRPPAFPFDSIGPTYVNPQPPLVSPITAPGALSSPPVAPVTGSVLQTPPGALTTLQSTTPPQRGSRPPAPPPEGPPPALSHPPPRRSKTLRTVLLAMLVLLVVVGGTIGAVFALKPTQQVSGQVAFFDNPNSPQGATDALEIATQGLSTPPSGSHYDTWLINDQSEQVTALGTLVANGQGQDALNYSRSLTIGQTPVNLVGAGNRIEITLERGPVNVPTGKVILSAAFPPLALVHIRHLLYSFPTTPGKIGLVTGLLHQVQLLNAQAILLQSFASSGNQFGIQCLAQSIIDISEGIHGAHYKPLSQWCKTHCSTLQTGDGFGILGHGPAYSYGYDATAAAHAVLAASQPDATASIRANARVVEISTNDVNGWTTTIDQDAQKLLANPADTSSVPEIVTLSDHAYYGVLDPNGQVNPAPGVAGAITANVHAQLMASLVLSTQPA